MSAVRYAEQGGRHDRIPSELIAATLSNRDVVPWLCPDCHRVVAETVVDHVTDDLRTVRTVLPFEFVHKAAADRDGLPFYGPTDRAMRGKGPRRSVEKRRSVAYLRAIASGTAQADLAPSVDVLAFDTLCLGCPLRLRITLPPR